MSIKQNNTYFKETDGKIYYYDNEGNKTDVPSSAFGNLDDKINTKLDTSAFEDVSGTFYTTDNPSRFIDKSVNDLTNYYTTAQTYTQTEIDEKLADFGGFEVVQLDASGKPDVADPSTKIIYLTKDSESQAKDPYTEWIYTNDSWEVIGETTVDLSDYQTTAAMTGYYTKNETSAASALSDEFAKYVQTTATGTWDVTEYSGTNGIDITGHEVGLSSDYKTAIESISSDYQTIAGMIAYQPSGNYMSANALDSVSGTWNEVSAKVDTTAIFTGSSAGLVPSATSGDENKLLGGDGIWTDVEVYTKAYIDSLPWMIGPSVVIGGREYPVVQIGNQLWIAENLDFAWDGLTVGGSTSTSEARANYYNNDEATYGFNGDKYGLLYNQPAIEYLNTTIGSLLPGWHIADISDFRTLGGTIGTRNGNGYDYAGEKLKSTEPSEWNGTDIYGFSWKPAGTRNSDGSFSDGVSTHGGIGTIRMYGYNWRPYVRAAGNDLNEGRTSYDNDKQYPIRLVKTLT